MTLVHTYKRNCNRSESKYRRIPYCTLNPLQPNGQETPFLPESLSYPSEHTTLLVLEHGSQLSRHKGCWNKEHQCRKQIIERGTHSVLRLSRQSSQAHYRRNIHDCQGEHAQLGNLFCIAVHISLSLMGKYLSFLFLLFLVCYTGRGRILKLLQFCNCTPHIGQQHICHIPCKSLLNNNPHYNNILQ